MAEASVEILNAEDRTRLGSRASRYLRNEGRLPAVLYGHGGDTVSMTVMDDDFHRVLRHGGRVVELLRNGQKEKALIKEVQYDPLGMEIMHIDFARVSVDERIELSVPIEFRGDAPGVLAGGVLDQAIHELPIECSPMHVPEAIRVFIGELQMDESIAVKDLEIPDGVKVMVEPDATVVQITPPAAEEEVEEAAEQAEPELIGRGEEEASEESPGEE